MDKIKIPISLTEEEWNYIVNTLGLKPYKEVSSLISYLQIEFLKEIEKTKDV